MAGKRQAGTELNHLNWDKDEEPEDVGVFQTAPEHELKNRVIKKAKRKLPETCNTDAVDGDGKAQVKSIFSGFSGFKAATSTSSTSAGAFSFLSKIPTIVASNATSTTNNAMNNFTSASESSEKKTFTIDSTVTVEKNYEFEKSSTYYSQLKSLNNAVSNWIKMHVDKNPICILTPIFKDYENYLNEIEKGEKETDNAPTSSLQNANKKPGLDFSQFKFSASPASSATSAAPTFSFGNTKPATSEACSTSTGVKPDQPKANGFNFSFKSDDKPSGSNNQSIFNINAASSTSTNANDDKPTSTVFSFSNNNNKPFTFFNVAPTPAPATSVADADPGAGAATEENDEEDQPPKVEFKPVVEEDAIYSKRCKLYVKNDGQFCDRGVGMLYFKPIKESGKTQMLMRADTNLGNILANFILNESIPAQRTGKNNVMLVCVPTPETEKATPILFRVKTSEEADELLSTIEKYKKT